MYEHTSTKSVKISVGHLYPLLSGANVPECGIKMPPADNVSLAVLAQVCNGINRYRKVPLPFMQIVGTIAPYINGQLLRNSPLKYVGPRIRLLALQKHVGTPRKIQQL